jgi:membrane-associated protease RseP (regulator of RpoE activity)
MKRWNWLFVVFGMMLFLGMQNAALAAPSASERDGEAWLGVYLQELNDAMREALDIEGDVGVLITEVSDDSPAEKAGFKVGDVIVEFDGREIYDGDDLRRAVRRTDPGDKVKVVIIRDGKRRTLTVEMGERPRSRRRVYGRPWDDLRAFAFSFGRRAYLGVELAELNPDLGSYFDVKEGVLVIEVIEDSPADKAGLRAGDVIVAIDGETVRDPEAVFEILREYREGDRVEIEIVRHGKRQKIEARLAERRRWRPRRYGDAARFFYFYGIPRFRGGDGWEWDWDWDWEREMPRGRGFLRVFPWWLEDDEVRGTLPEDRDAFRRMIRIRSLL